jgi:hypothetical protein
LYLPDGGVVPVWLEEMAIAALALQVVFHRPASPQDSI